MASLSDLPEPQRRRAVQIGYWTWIVLIIGATAAILFVRNIFAVVMAPLSGIFVLAFVVLEIYQVIYIRRAARESRRDQ